MKLVYILVPLAIILPLVFGYGANFLLDENELGPDTSDLLVESRDATRISDISNVSAAIGLYLATTNEKLNCDPLKIYRSDMAGRQVDGTGWVPVNLNLIPGGSPLVSLPVDPMNGPKFHYVFVCDPTSNTYEISAAVEGTKFLSLAESDEGSDPSRVEYGNNLKLIR